MTPDQAAAHREWEDLTERRRAIAVLMCVQHRGGMSALLRNPGARASLLTSDPGFDVRRATEWDIVSLAPLCARIMGEAP